ncbi:PepSY domain-containing protein [Nesterenkonia sp. F]|uniref:PepSY domain-containing protein n=1 Tax=Nesterenkonia sp. F TaxID=795955 RepID=UPI000255CB3D|nr:hypothetical protein [Nesterenkonia sp. F]
MTSTRSSATVVAVMMSAALLSGCGIPDGPQGGAEGAEASGSLPPSNEPSAENPTSTADVDAGQDVALRAVSTAIGDGDAAPVAFNKSVEGAAGMSVDLLAGDGTLQHVTTVQDGSEQVEAEDQGEAEDQLQQLAEAAEVPMLRAMDIALTESPGVLLSAELQDREGDLVVWVITVEGATSDNRVVVDASNGAVVPEGQEARETATESPADDG